MSPCGCAWCSVWPLEQASDCERYQGHPVPWWEQLDALVEAWWSRHRGDAVLDATDAVRDLDLPGAGDVTVEDAGRLLAGLERESRRCCGDPSCPDCDGTGWDRSAPVSRVSHYPVRLGPVTCCPVCWERVYDEAPGCTRCGAVLVVAARCSGRAA